MKSVFTILFFCLACAAGHSQTVFVVRHGERADGGASSNMMQKDPPLSEAGNKRAEALKELLKTENIGYIFSTNTIRTRSTAEPTRAYFNLTTANYSPMPDSAFINSLKLLDKNVLIVGHSNTVDDIVNKLCPEAKLSDLPDSAYDNLFVIVKKGGKLVFENRKYGDPSQ